MRKNLLIKNLALDFRRKFVVNRTNVLLHDGEKIYANDIFHLKKGTSLKIRLVSTKSPYRQAIVVQGKNKEFSIKGIEGSYRHINLWEDTMPKDGAVINAVEDNTEINIYNFYKLLIDNKQAAFPALASAMKIDILSDKVKRYRCNDFELDDDFNDLIFTVETLE